jgi:predicted nucleic acid-binding protein
MILVDTSIWIEFLRQQNEEIQNQLEIEIENGKVIALSFVFGELLQGVRSTKEEEVIISLWHDLFKIDEGELFFNAGRLSSEHKLYSKGVGLIDSALLFAAKSNRFVIWSLDKKLLESARQLNVEHVE